MELKLPPSTLVVFVDETGHETLPSGHVVYGLGGCAALDADLDQLVRIPWRKVRTTILGNPEKPLHAAGLSITREQQALIGDFFRTNAFMRVAVAATAKTLKPDSLMLTEVLAPALIKRICDVMNWTRATSVILIFEANDRTKATIQRCFGGITIGENGIDIRMECYFMPKNAGEPALEVADFIMHSVHGLARDKLNRKDAYKRRDFQSVFQSVDRRLASFMLIDKIEPGPSAADQSEISEPRIGSEATVESTRETDAFLGETLFHFLGNSADDVLLDVFDSIARRGLLLTVGNKDGRLDRFRLNMQGGGTETLEVMQHARTCFTDIPIETLMGHSQQYGRFGIGFSRQTILAWGGNPVIYLPNHPTAGTLEETMGSMLYCMHRIPLLIAALKACMSPGNAALTINETTLLGTDRDRYIDQAEQSLRRMFAFVKEMSSSETNDYKYLYEREWRIVDGAMTPGFDPSRELTLEEIDELGRKCSRWNSPLELDATTLQRYPHTRMSQFFRFFNGLSGPTVAQAIDLILVPNAALQERVSTYIQSHQDRFSSPAPEVRLFGVA